MVKPQGQNRFRTDILIAIGTLVSLSISAAAFYDSHREAVESHRQAEAQGTANVSFLVDTDTDDPVVGLKIMNDGPGVARLKQLTYYLDRKPMDNLSEALDDIDSDAGTDLADDGVTFEFDKDSTLAAGEQHWLLSMPTKVKKAQQKDLDQLNALVSEQLAVEVDYCSVVTGACETRCSRDGWCK
jgi:hypothetical protein